MTPPALSFFNACNGEKPNLLFYLWDGKMLIHNSFTSTNWNKITFRVLLSKTGRLFMLLAFLLSLAGGSITSVKAATIITFTGQELLGRPTDTSITVSVVPDSAASIYYEYGTSEGNYTDQTSTGSATAGQPYVVTISGLSADTQYYYRMQYSTDGGSTWTARAEHSFYTQRAPGDTFTFDITSDSHVNIMLGSASEWTKTLNNVAADHPDFHLDLGDTFAMDSVTTASGAENAYKFQLQYFNLISHSAPIFLVSGNHEQTEGWHLDDNGNPANSLPVWGTNAMKKYFLNPVPDGSFYSGDADPYSYLDGDHLREDYYAWTWGDALFVVIDPFWFTTTKPYIGNTGGGESSDTGSGNRWDWTVGLEQFNWLKTTLQSSTAKYKFVFAHQMPGGSEDYGHGGANSVNLVEMGGYNEAGTIYEWDTKRPVVNWGSVALHQLMVNNGVSAFFHGHDHQYGYEERDGVVYQEVPSAGFTGNGFGLYTTGNGYTIKALPSDGHLRVTVSPSQATVDYIKTSDASNAYTYTIAPNASVTTHTLTTAVSPSEGGTIVPATGVNIYNEGTVLTITATPAAGYTFNHWDGDCIGTGACQVIMNADMSVTAYFVPATTILGDVNGDGSVNSTDALIILSCDAGLDTSGFCPMNCGDVNNDTWVNSTDALIVLSYDAGMTISFPVGEPGCPASVIPGPGCNP
jgi:hypothetical protein